ncbi:MAG: FRG domain-containing protein, partial [Lachnospiraceae bacterium]|nr:FRG domain-containing protein [Lachnospiraceae bacterium]
MDDILSKLDRLDDIVDEMDFDYSVGEVHIDTMEQFREKLLEPAQDRSVKRFYRGERISSLKRPLLPTMFRDREALIGKSSYADIDAAYILKHYRETPFYFELYSSTFGQARKYCMYDLCAFSQHYLNWSPFIDFSKSLFVALSFGLKAKHSFE